MMRRRQRRRHKQCYTVGKVGEAGVKPIVCRFLDDVDNHVVNDNDDDHDADDEKEACARYADDSTSTRSGS